MIVCAAPNPSIDKLFLSPSLTIGEIHRPDRLVARPGGKGLNVARAAHALGADVMAVALLAGHAGRWIAERLDVPHEIVWAEGETRTSLSVAADDTLTEFYERGDPPGPAWDAFVEAVRRPCDWLALSGSLPPGVTPTQSAVIAGAADRVAVDQEGPALAAALQTGPDLVKVNRHEAAALTGHDDPERALRTLADHAAAVVVTLGTDGAIALTPEGSWHARLDVRGPYPTGSGDAFLAGLLSGDGGWRDALALAMGAGAANAETPGAGSFDPGRARALARRVRCQA